jgi:CRISPR/Cas system-associated exonuclease Cas4 (RecB family)
MADDEPWTTPSELAEYVFCPRAAYYRSTQPAPPSRGAEAGTEFHVARLSAERRRDERSVLPWVAVLGGSALLALAIVLAVLR